MKDQFTYQNLLDLNNDEIIIQVLCLIFDPFTLYNQKF